MSALLLTQSPGDKVQTGTGKVDPARNFKCTTAARDMNPPHEQSLRTKLFNSKSNYFLLKSFKI